MQIRIFTIPVGDSGALQAEMNAFLSGHRVLEIEQKFFFPTRRYFAWVVKIKVKKIKIFFWGRGEAPRNAPA